MDTIWFDDILDYFPKESTTTLATSATNRKALLKIDIEGFESFAFTHAKKLFDSIEIPIILMEWGFAATRVELGPQITLMVDFLVSYKLKPFGEDKNVPLNMQDWTKWPWDIYWIKEGY